MQPVFAVDIGSNGIRLLIANVNSKNELIQVEKVRCPVRLGTDSFGSGSISAHLVDELVEALRFFKKVIQKHGVRVGRVVATSALRDAKNGDQVVKQLSERAQFNVERISGDEEGKLIFKAVNHTLLLENHTCAFLDIGGGSIELGASKDGKMGVARSFPYGTVRWIEKMREKNWSESELSRLFKSETKDLISFAQSAEFRATTNPRALEFLVGTGGNLEAIGKMHAEVLGKKGISKVSKSELEQMIIQVTSMNLPERIHVLKMRKDRADVIVPAMILTHTLMETLKVDKLRIPHVGLREGVAIDLIERVENFDPRISARNVLKGVFKN